MPNPFFADLVREMCQEGGTGPLTPTGAVPGHRRFAGTVPADTPFHYAVAGIAQPGQWEVGLGRIDSVGRLQRDSVAASSNADGPVDFAPGLKTIALTVGSEWFAAQDMAADALADALADKQPLSTTHAAAATGAADDLVTVRRGTGWVNIPLSSLPYRGADGRHLMSGALGCANGSAALPSLAFAADPGAGLFRPGTNMIGFATGGAERVRIDAAGNLGIGVSVPASRLHIAGAGGSPLACCDVSYGSLGDSATGLRCGLNGGAGGAFVSGYSNEANIAHNCEFINGSGWVARGAVASRHLQEGGAHIWFGNTGLVPNSGFTPIERLRLEAGGTLRAAADNGQSLGSAAFRWSVVYAGTGTINTSDAREKLWRGGANAAELRAARRIAAELGFFRWMSAIAAKGPDRARLHFGVRAQAVWAIMADEGLIDPIDGEGRPGETPYAFLCWDEWREPGEETAAGQAPISTASGSGPIS